MRVMTFQDYVDDHGYGDAFINEASHSMHKRRAAYNAFRTMLQANARCGLVPALDFLRANGKADFAHAMASAYSGLRHNKDEEPWDILRLIDRDVVSKVNDELDKLAKAERDSAPKLYAAAVGGVAISHAALPAFDTPTGFMTPRAWTAAGGPHDIAAIRRIFLNDSAGERSAPVQGYTHVHVNGDARNVMSYDMPNKRIYAFTDHMDSTNPGKAESAKAKAAIDDAGVKGWVWVAVTNLGLQRITSIK